MGKAELNKFGSKARENSAVLRLAEDIPVLNQSQHFPKALHVCEGGLLRRACSWNNALHWFPCAVIPSHLESFDDVARNATSRSNQVPNGITNNGLYKILNRGIRQSAQPTQRRLEASLKVDR